MLALDVAASPRATRRRSGDLGSRPGSAPAAAPAHPPTPLAAKAPVPAQQRRRSATALLCCLLLPSFFFFLAWRWGGGGQGRAPAGLPASCTPADAPTRARLFADLGGFSPLGGGGGGALNAGLLLAVGYHRAAAAAARGAAAAASPADPLPRWALAYALGPGANRAAVAGEGTPFPAFSPGDWAAARAAALGAAAAARAQRPPSAFALALTAAMADVRYRPGSSPADPAARAAAEAAYAGEMGAGVAGAAPTPAAASLALALAAEATAEPVQWAAVDGGTGALVPAAAAALGLVRRALALDPGNPLALHLAIHLAEGLPPAAAAAGAAASSAAAAARALGLASAAALAGPGPWAAAPVPHLLHMAGHAYARAGAWGDAVAAGQRAMRGDARLAAACVESYAVEHNAAAVAHAANLGGDVAASAAAAAWAGRAVDAGGPALAYAGGTREATLPAWAAVLFADWARVRALPPLTPASRGLCVGGGREFAGAVRAWADAMAAAAAVARGSQPRPALAAALAALQAAAAAVPPEPPTAPGPAPGIYACAHTVIASRLLRSARARADWLDGRRGEAAAVLAALAEEEAGDGYMEPPRSPFPARPCAGWAAMGAGDVGRAEAHFAADLAERPNHARALVGLAAVKRARGDEGGAAGAEAAARRAWAGRALPPSACPSFSEV